MTALIYIYTSLRSYFSLRECTVTLYSANVEAKNEYCANNAFAIDCQMQSETNEQSKCLPMKNG